MKVARLQLWHVEVPTPKPFFPSWLPAYPQTENRFTLLRIFTKDGRAGVAAGPAFNRERQGLGVLLGPYLLDVAVDDLATVRQRIREASFLGWRNPWIEAAFLDLWGKLEGKPVATILGGSPRRVEAYTSTGETTTPENAAAKAELAVADGTSMVKFRAHAPTLEKDLEALRAAARAADEKGIRFAVDANQGWFVTATGPAARWDLDRARAYAKAAGELGCVWLEEPLDMRDFDAMAKLRAEKLVPIAGAELAGLYHEIEPMIEKGCLDVYQPDATLCGGAETSLAVARECERRGLGFAPHMWTSGIGLLYNAHILGATSSRGPLEWPHDEPGWPREVRDGILREPLALDDKGHFEVPRAPGLGAEVDEARLKRYGTKFYDATPATIAWEFVKSKGLLEAFRYKKRRSIDSRKL
ncbi:MAG: mandelate racemase/muconate lactonizing enzyme family protein [Methanobacteriota archaeon]